jgi:16S rRNA (cytidine1402-2'-O)-methyltransferase
LTALTVSGLPTDRFFFEGFLPAKASQRRARIAELARIPASLLLFESGPRIAETLADLASAFGAREASICRELTKLHEEVRRAALPALAAHYASDAETRGEFVIVIAPPAEEAQPEQQDVDAMIRAALARISVKDAVAEIVAATGLPRRDIYQRALELAKDRDAAS